MEKRTGKERRGREGGGENIRTYRMDQYQVQIRFPLGFSISRSISPPGSPSVLFTGLNPDSLTHAHVNQHTAFAAIGDLVTPSQCVVVWTCPPSSYVGNLIPNASSVGNRSSERQLGHRIESLVDQCHDSGEFVIMRADCYKSESSPLCLLRAHLLFHLLSCCDAV